MKFLIKHTKNERGTSFYQIYRRRLWIFKEPVLEYYHEGSKISRINVRYSSLKEALSKIDNGKILENEYVYRGYTIIKTTDGTWFVDDSLKDPYPFEGYGVITKKTILGSLEKCKLGIDNLIQSRKNTSFKEYISYEKTIKEERIVHDRDNDSGSTDDDSRNYRNSLSD